MVGPVAAATCSGSSASNRLVLPRFSEKKKGMVKISMCINID